MGFVVFLKKVKKVWDIEKFVTWPNSVKSGCRFGYKSGSADTRKKTSSRSGIRQVMIKITN